MHRSVPATLHAFPLAALRNAAHTPIHHGGRGTHEDSQHDKTVSVNSQHTQRVVYTHPNTSCSGSSNSPTHIDTHRHTSTRGLQKRPAAPRGDADARRCRGDEPRMRRSRKTAARALGWKACHPSPASHDAVGGWSLVELCSPQNRAVDVAVSFLKAVQATAMSGREFGARSMRSAQVPAGV